MAKITMKEVARKANVSTATVSRVINNKPVSAILRQKVLEAINYYNYTPNSIARSLKVQKSKTIALIVSDTYFPFYATVSSHIEKDLRNAGYMMLFASHQDDKDLEIKCIETMLNMQVDAIIIAPTNLNDEYLCEIAKTTPMLFLERSSKHCNMPFVGSDKRFAFYTLTKHLFELNHRNFVFIAAGKHISSTYQRFTGIMDFIYENNLPMNSVMCEYDDFSFNHGYNTTKKILGIPEESRPTAIISANSDITAGALCCCKDNNISIPEDMSVASFGNFFYFDKLIDKPMTYVDDLREVIGSFAVEKVLKLMSRNKLTQNQVFIKPELILGQTTGPIHRG